MLSFSEEFWEVIILSGSCIVPVLGYGGAAALGLLCTPLSILTFGKIPKLNEVAGRTLAAREIIPEIVRGSFRFIYPQFRYHNRERITHDYLRSFARYPEVASFTTEFLGSLTEQFFRCCESRSSFKREIGSRVLSLISIPVALVARVADLALGILLLLPLEVYCKGEDEELNDKMAQLLNIVALIDDVARGVRGVFTPYIIFTLTESPEEYGESP